MRKLLALLLTLAMTLSLLSVGFVSTSAEMPAGAIAIDTYEELAAMQAGNYYYLTANITVGSPRTLGEQGGEYGDMAAVEEPNEEADIITIPAGVTLDGNGFTIYSGNYIVNPGMYNETTPWTHSLDWTHEMFTFSAGNKTTLKNLKFGDDSLPIYLNARGILSGTSDWSVPMFADVEGSNVEWDNVVFTVSRQAGTQNLKSMNTSAIIATIKGTHVFNGCELTAPDGVGISAGSQGGAWFYTSNAGSSLTMNDCVTSISYLYGSYVAGTIHTPKGTVTLTNCRNEAVIQGSYNDTGGFVSAFVGNAGNSVEMTNCVNNGALYWRGGAENSLTIGGSMVGRTSTTVAKLHIVNCTNNGILDAAGKGIKEGNHGFGGIAGHVSATDFLVDNCVNNANIKGTGTVGGIVGRVDGGTDPVVSNCKNYGSISFKTTNCQEIGGIVGQINVQTTIQNCVNYGSITGNSARGNAGILATTFGSGDNAIITNCINYGSIYNNTYSAGMIAQVSASTTATIQNSMNFGDLTTGHTVGGMIAQVAGTSVDIDDCLNAGTIGNHASNEGVGGFIGRVASTAPVITIDDSANIGTIKGSTKNSNVYGAFGDTFGQFIGLYTVSAMAYNYAGSNRVGGFHDWTANAAVKPTLTNCYAYGTATPAATAKSLTGWITADETGTAYAANTSYIASTVAVTEAPKDGVVGINVEYTGTVTLLENVEFSAAVATLKELFDLDFMAGSAEEDKIVVATPALRGYQMSTDGTSIRFLSTISSLNYANVGYTYSATVNGNPVQFAGSELVDESYVKTVTTEKVLLGVNENTDAGTASKTAAEMGGKYLVAITFQNIPAEGEVVITLTPNAGEFDGTTYVITIVDGVLTSYAAQ